MVWGLWLGAQDWSHHFQFRSKILISLMGLQASPSFVWCLVRAPRTLALLPVPMTWPHMNPVGVSTMFFIIRQGLITLPPWCITHNWCQASHCFPDSTPAPPSCPSSLGLHSESAHKRMAASSWSRALHHFCQPLSHNLSVDQVVGRLPIPRHFISLRFRLGIAPLKAGCGFLLHARTLDRKRVFLFILSFHPFIHSLHQLNLPVPICSGFD